MLIYLFTLFLLYIKNFSLPLYHKIKVDRFGLLATTEKNAKTHFFSHLAL